MLTGTLHWDESNRSYVLHAKDGGCWFVDMPWRSRRLLGREVTVEGVRSGFNLLDAVRIRDGAAKRPRSRHRSALAASWPDSGAWLASSVAFATSAARAGYRGGEAADFTDDAASSRTLRWPSSS
ncbi:DUF5818 domain-containing protein [Sphingomonas sp. GV3]|uniref:DUF5818 domain-containing protein n=1 Tax=Sphingomonas sp. GV3 TaxID=3040671 RepID=UPI00280BB060|nr:DUF5818 domain-containing protein [Sphingomonas sp. GV3]